MIRAVALPDGTPVASLGQGTWHMGESAGTRGPEVAALRLGIDLGMTLIDTAEMYADGGAETVVAEAMAGQRDRVFVVSKVYPQNASRAGVVAACERSLRRLRTERIDLYLLHWRGAVKLAETVAGFDDLLRGGKIRYWGVSNLDTDDMDELAAVPGGAACATDQVLYNLQARGPEYDLLPWCAAHAMPVMAYSPVGQGGALLRHAALRRVGERHAATPAQVALAWTLLLPGIVSIPKASELSHVRDNAVAADLVLTALDTADLDAAFPPPRKKRSLEML
jgi:diketogulonate reductase-like aldo/keto reductase